MSELTLNLTTNNETSGARGVEDDEYERFLADLWVGIVLTLMVLSCVGCLCTCFLYHTFKQWQRRVAESRRAEGDMHDTESLPSYTVAAGLPSYEEAMEQLKQSALAAQRQTTDSTDTGGHIPVFSSLSVGDLMEIYKADVKK